VRPHLAKVIQVWKERIVRTSPATSGRVPSVVSDHAVDRLQTAEVTEADENTVEELGFLDYMEIGEEANATMQAALRRMTVAMEELGNQIRKHNVSTDNASVPGDLKTVKTIANEVAADLNAFAKSTAAEIPILAEAYADVLRAFSGAGSIVVEAEGGKGQVETALAGVEQLRLVVEQTREQLLDFAGKVRSTPRMTTHLNRAKQRALKVMEELGTELDRARGNSLMVEASMRDLLNRGVAKA
jgi:hypothetical protein